MAIDDEAGLAFNNGTIEGEGHKTEPETLAEGATLQLAYVRNNENFCLRVSESFDRDEGDDGYSPLGVFGADGDYNDERSGGRDGDEYHHRQHSRKTGAQPNKRAGKLTLAWEALLTWELP
jgi:hypothetical protein